ncbi:2Fe-2S iron-sulfur cluster-binding protein [Paenibacillus sp. GD4]|uniref:2Fe-2S iron-sulfur cluster-binding protein n=1 Tax=Paenibacillus sp. GD4 TaxID=3068890 RepID=UPI0027965AF8|nr:2Fe-2S iron-sulfur cluster-binding protein [Paenibacillus sp. GD4]MDQ1909429.1 2Fe-2S iron-sulfur cluster-binding protein [Paenibacillus sp. GD4]
MLTIKGRQITKTVEAEAGLTVLDHALKHNVDFGFSCMRGTCARCRCVVTEGAELLSKPTDEELDRLEPEELEQGYRLGCQAQIKQAGTLVAANKPYF